MEFSGLSEASLRLGVFLGVFALMSSAEAAWPRRPRLFTRRQRWPTNLLILAIGGAAVRGMAVLSVPLVAVAAASWAAARGIGLLNVVAAPGWLAIAGSVLLLDLLIWAQHLASHRIPLFWRLHRVHHADRDIDASTALRFHPIEIALSMLVKCAAVLALGAPVVAVIIFEIVLNGMAIFNHANVRLPSSIDRLLRRLLVTPDMHRVHHSTDPREHHRNFGFNLSIWDRLFSTYRAQPDAGHDRMTIGLAEYQSNAPGQFIWCLALPFGAGAPPAQSKPQES